MHTILRQVLCTTSTLAMGMNLPAHLVVIKGTRRYVGSEAEDASGYEEYERSTVLQVPRAVLRLPVGLLAVPASSCSRRSRCWERRGC